MLPAVLIMSFASDQYSSVLDNAIQELADLGVVPIGASGNERIDGCETYPAALSNVISVGSTDAEDKLSEFSNYGRCVDVYV